MKSTKFRVNLLNEVKIQGVVRRSGGKWERGKGTVRRKGMKMGSECEGYQIVLLIRYSG